MDVNNSTSYWGFGKRFLAALIDGILIGIVSGGGLFLFHSIDGTNAAGALLGLIYFPFMESSSHQATIGKMAMGIKVTGLNGNRIDLTKAIVRYLCKFISAIILFIGFIMVAFTPKKQGLHDIIAGTLVINK